MNYVLMNERVLLMSNFSVEFFDVLAWKKFSIFLNDFLSRQLVSSIIFQNLQVPVYCFIQRGRRPWSFRLAVYFTWSVKWDAPIIIIIITITTITIITTTPTTTIIITTATTTTTTTPTTTTIIIIIIEWMNECLTTPQHEKQIGYWVSEKGKCMK